jgi:hypothetical protein
MGVRGFALLALGALAAAPGVADAAERGYELVSPADSGAYEVVAGPTSPSGDAASYMSILGSPDGVAAADGRPEALRSTRGPDGWSWAWDSDYVTQGARNGAPTAQGFRIASTGTRSLFVSSDAVIAGLIGAAQPNLWLRDGAGHRLLTATIDGTAPPGVTFTNFAADDSLSTIAFRTQAALDPNVDVDGNGADIYAVREGQLELVSRPSHGPFPPSGAVTLPLASVGERTPTGSPVSEDGSRITFQTSERLDPVADQDTVDDVYQRVGDETILVSPTKREPAGTSQSVSLVGASADGTRLFLSTTEQLLDEDQDSWVDLYRYTVTTDTLELVTSGTSPANAAPTLVAVSRDGRRAFFQSAEILAPGATATPTLYAWDAYPVFDGERRAVVGAVTAAATNARASADGRALVFESTVAQAGDSDARVDVFVWREGQPLACASCAASDTGQRDALIGYVKVGGNPTFNALWPGNNANNNRRIGRVISDDGAIVFFTSAEPLAAGAADNGLTKVYEWNRGDLRLVSHPGDHADASYSDSSADGRSVFFTSRATLDPRDEDGGFYDLYVARVGGGFPVPPSPIGGPAPVGSTGSLAPPTEGALPTTEPADPDPPPPPIVLDEDTADAGGDGSVARVSIRAEAARVRGRVIRLRARVPAVGVVRVTLRRGSTAVARGRARVDARGPVGLELRVTPGGRRLLRARRQIAARWTARFVADDGRRSSARGSIVVTGGSKREEA